VHKSASPTGRENKNGRFAFANLFLFQGVTP
jgi:hypothetical protein